MTQPALRFVMVILVLSLSASCGKNQQESSNAEGPGATQAAGETDTAATAENVEELVDAIVAEAGALPRHDFDSAALAARLGKDPQAHFEWVRDRTWWAPYRGMLRGSQGVMLDRVGSSLDRAVLLGDLLRRSGHNVRLAHARLPEPRARELLGRLRSIPDQRREPVAPRADSAERQRTLESVMPGYQQDMQRRIDEFDRLMSEARSLARSQADLLRAKLGSAAARGGTDDRIAVAALQDHWWVEREDGGKWVAMDVLLPDAKPGVTLLDAASRSAWGTGSSLPAIPESEWHTVKIRVVIENYDGGITTENTVLDAAIRPADGLEHPVMFGHLPSPWPDSLPDPASDPDALANAAVSVKEWWPYLRIGDQYVTQSGFTEAGTVVAAPAGTAVTDLGDASGGFMVGFGEALGGGETAASSLTAEWIDYEIRVPGEPSQLIRRPVFDLLGPMNRSRKVEGFDANTNDRLVARYEALLSGTEILVQSCDVSGEFVSHIQSASIVANRSALLGLSRERDPTKLRELASEVLPRIDSWGPLLRLAKYRSIVGGQGPHRFIHRPNILNYRITQPVVNTDRLPARELIDIVSNAVGVRPASLGMSFDVRLDQGVADTIAEMLALGGELRSAENTASVFAIVGASADDTVLLGSRGSESATELGWTGDVEARLTDTVKAGFLAVVPRKSATLNGHQSLGWWRVDPNSGETIGVMDSGYHQGLTEDELNRAETSRRSLLNWRLDQDHSRMEAIRSRIARGRPVSDAARADLELYDLVNRMLTTPWNLRYL